MRMWRALAGALVLGTIVGGFFWLRALHLFELPAVPSGHQAAGPASAEAASTAPMTMRAVDQPDSSEVRRVYQCQRGSEVAYSDQPCGTNGSVKIIDTAKTNTYSAQATVPQRDIPARFGAVATAPQPTTSEEVMPEKAEQCRLIEAQIRTIDERTRHPYMDGEGERLRLQRHKLEAERWQLRCGW